MAVYNLSFLNPNVRKTGGGNSGAVIDQLTIYENTLKQDGKLSPGDYDLLIEKAEELANSGALSAAQRSNMRVKVSAYQRDKELSDLSSLRDIDQLNRESEDDNIKTTMLLGNNPEAYLTARNDALELKLERLTDAINGLEQSGDDPTNHVLAFNEALNDYNDFQLALDQVRQSGGQATAPVTDLVAYITTNSQGEINNVKIGRVGSESGFVETNGLYGGMQIYGKVNKKEFGKNIFRLGNKTFEGSDLTIQDPSNPGAFRRAPLLSRETSGGRNVGLVVDTYDPVDPSNLRSQTTIRNGGWAKGSSGAFYFKKENGEFKKFINVDQNTLGLSDGEVLRVPSFLEQNINRSATETIDAVEGPATPGLPNFSPVPGSGASPFQPAPDLNAPQPSPEAQGRPREGSPISRAPQNAERIAQRAVQGAGNLVRGFFNRA